ncbi:MAG: hypothetical protein KAX38_07310, partial [Candidatus Krumholzibacteria bacterium]|nr:hypothetical protein [Candidatus Krumholzibacteria bacterium]
MTKTNFERLEIGGPDIAVFRISGKLGFHENLKIQRLTKECQKRNFKRVIFDFSELLSLGGGVARILRNFVGSYNKGAVCFVVTNEIVLQFLQDDQSSFSVYSSLEDALGKGLPPERGKPIEGNESIETASREDDADKTESGDGAGRAADETGEPADDEAPPGSPDIILMSYDESAAPRSEPGVGKGTEKSGKKISEEGASVNIGQDGECGAEKEVEQEIDRQAAEISGEHQGVISEIFGEDFLESPPDWIKEPVSPFNMPAGVEKGDLELLSKQLKRRILELKTLFSISADFNAIRDRKKLLDIFLLTSIA